MDSPDYCQLKAIELIKQSMAFSGAEGRHAFIKSAIGLLALSRAQSNENQSNRKKDTDTKEVINQQ